MTLLLGPPGAGKTTLLQALAGKLDIDLKSSGKISYCGHELEEFVPRKTSCYIGENDLHFEDLTVCESLDFSRKCLGVGERYELLVELIRRDMEEAEMNKANPLIDVFLRALASSGKKASFMTNYILKILELESCADTIIGNEMRKGTSGGEKKRVTTGEMLVGLSQVLFMDEISTGLDSSTTFQICKFLRQMVHLMDMTMLVSLLQPPPETFQLFDDIILLAEGEIVYQGPGDNNVLEFFEHIGFKCPPRKGIADFLQEVISKKDQQQYWFKDEPYTYVSVPEFARLFASFHAGQNLAAELEVPYDKSRIHTTALVREKYGISKWELFKICFSREWLLMKRSSFVFIFKTTQIMIMATITFTVFFRSEMPVGTIEGGQKFLGAMFFSLLNMMFNGVAETSMTLSKLPVFYKQRESLFYPAWAFGLPIWILRIPLSLVESGIWVILTYYTIGFAPNASRFFRQFLAFFGIHQMAFSLFRLIAAIGRTPVVADTLGICILQIVFALGGFVVSQTLGASKGVILDEANGNSEESAEGTEMRIRKSSKIENTSRGMVLPFQPLTIAFNHVNYYVDIPTEKKVKGKQEHRLQILRDVSGAFRPGILTALVGVSGAGKTTLMDVEERQVDTLKEVLLYQAFQRTKPHLLELAVIANKTISILRIGGQVIFAGPLGPYSKHLTEYFEAIPGVPKIKNGYYLAICMLEISDPAIKSQLDIDFAEIYANSALYQTNQEFVQELSQTQQDLMDLLGAMYGVVLFLGGMNASPVQSVIDTERIVLYRERAAGMYSALPYAFGQVNTN
ncbi:pleiotropic drug resistance protein 2 [Senna tora]|uniref:Pleiotropic drug resistance protein 2 n=1 Tax=Senna tora TaxID=362788 RepID=A0A835CKQ4_9FABA|nr:pleiotropic drug resistance protein 2 [Senna tora]